jgi:branched-chain amino acid transport system ATP-binding protein
MLLKVIDIEVYYGKAQAVKGISLEVKKGEITTIIGPNGAGKTTTLKTIAGIIQNSSGEIWYEGYRIDKDRRPEKMIKKGISVCLEGRRLFPFMTVQENLEMGGYSWKDKAAIMREIEITYQRFPKLGERRKQKAGTLSGGEQQMVTIGRALISRPKLLLLDEPSLGLAPLIVRDVGTIIAELNKNGLTILLVEQNAQMALKLADKGYVLEVGEIKAEGDTQFLLASDYVREVYLGSEREKPAYHMD